MQSILHYLIKLSQSKDKDKSKDSEKKDKFLIQNSNLRASFYYTDLLRLVTSTLSISSFMAVIVILYEMFDKSNSFVQANLIFATIILLFIVLLDVLSIIVLEKVAHLNIIHPEKNIEYDHTMIDLLNTCECKNYTKNEKILNLMKEVDTDSQDVMTLLKNNSLVKEFL